jgi:hypothetical protein
MITRRAFGLGSLGLAAGAMLGRETGAAAESALVDSPQDPAGHADEVVPLHVRGSETGD